MKILVIGSCTGDKGKDYPKDKQLTEADFDDPARLERREQELSKWIKPAAEMYRGRQHTQMMDGVRLLRSLYGDDTCDVAILSAGYGLVSEHRPIAPYNVTFTDMPDRQIKDRGEKLELPFKIRNLTADYPLVFFLLGDKYLLSVDPPLLPLKKQRFVAFGTPKLRRPDGSDVIAILSADEAAKQYGGNPRFRKGRMLYLLAAGLKKKPEMLHQIMEDTTGNTVLALMQQGMQG